MLISFMFTRCDEEVLDVDIQCPKRVGSFGSSTRFLTRNESESDIDSDKKIMSLFYAKKSDEIGMCFMCASRVSTYMHGELVS